MAPPVEVLTTRRTPAARAASRTCSVPRTLTWRRPRGRPWTGARRSARRGGTRPPGANPRDHALDRGRASRTSTCGRSASVPARFAALPRLRSSRTRTSAPRVARRVDDVGADEAGATGHHCTHGRSLSARFWPVSAWQTILVVFVVPAVGLYLVITLLVVGPRLARRPRYRVGQPWPHGPMWWTANPGGGAAPGGGRPRGGRRGGRRSWQLVAVRGTRRRSSSRSRGTSRTAGPRRARRRGSRCPRTCRPARS